MKVTYIFHSCFVIELEKYILIFDYYKGKLPQFDAHKHILFFVSHQHGDHYTKDIWKYHNHYPSVSYIIDQAINLPDFVDGIQIQPHQRVFFHDIEIEALFSTDEGVAFLIDVEEKCIYHAGDLHWWHWQGEAKDVNDWQDKTFHEEIAKLQNKHIDIACIPLDPRQEENAWWGFVAVLLTASIKYAFPMHFGKNISDMQAYLSLPQLSPYWDRIMIIEKENQVFLLD